LTQVITLAAHNSKIQSYCLSAAPWQRDKLLFSHNLLILWQ